MESEQHYYFIEFSKNEMQTKLPFFFPSFEAAKEVVDKIKTNKMNNPGDYEMTFYVVKQAINIII